MPTGKTEIVFSLPVKYGEYNLTLTYRYKKIDDTREIWIRIEVDHNLYCGFVIAQNGEKSTPNFVNTNETVIKLFNKEYFGWFTDNCAAKITKLTEEMKLNKYPPHSVGYSGIALPLYWLGTSALFIGVE